MRSLVFISFFSLFLFSCKKKIYIKGMVYNPIKNEGIANIKVTLSTKNTEIIGSQDGSGYKLVETTQTDGSGNYTFENRISKSKLSKLTFVSDDDLFFRMETETFFFKTDQKNQTINYKLVPIGFLEENISNINCFDNNDIISIKFVHKNITDYYENKFIGYNGCFFHDGNYNSVPMGWYKYEGTVTKNGFTTPIKDSVYVPAGGYHTWNIEY